ncbi:AtzE family amidohydrolase [Lyngbya sp. CCY1209]|uniref:AtzE family amidohydrolase n=1 Tax=Lyngbya sp. CCY1209 TaxID=2886103 RepID=UPI002D1FD6C3|nr:AtzE family amidohydrolase [Lyngbya sp. CCY1209]MEB3883391.1 AtzE family amidohydrolase [Lyngbya sp. CCY1209]
MNIDLKQADTIAIAAAIKTGEITAKTVCEQFLEQIRTRNPTLNCFTEILAESAIADAEKIDRAIAAGDDPGPLAGVPFGVKNLFDIAGIPTLAGSKINRDNPPAGQDAIAVSRLKKAGAVLMGALNMDEYAYGFVTENAHYGATPNPHDPARVSGGSSGGSAASVAAGLLPLTLGTDTNGSIRVPASFCGVLGLKPTYGRLPRSGVVLFSASLDHIGPFARSLRDIALSFDILQGSDRADPACTARPPEPCSPHLEDGIGGLRIAVADGYFAQKGDPEVFAAVETVANALGVTRRVTIPEAHRARAAAYLITASEGSNLHLHNLRSRPRDFDPATRDRFLAGALIPSPWTIQAQRFRRWYRQQALDLFRTVDIILAPTTPCVAPLLGQKTMAIGGEEMLVRPNLGLYTQPLSFVGLPVLSVPVRLPGQLPLGVQIIAAPYREAAVLRVGRHLERAEIIDAAVAD